MSNLDHDDNQPVIVDFIHDAVDSLTHAVAFLACQLYAAVAAGIFGESIDAVEDAPHIRVGYGAQVLGHRLFEGDRPDPTAFHWPSGRPAGLRN